MSVESAEELQKEIDYLSNRLNELMGEKAMLVAACQDVYCCLVEPNPENGDPAPWDVVEDGHPVRQAAQRIVDILVSLGIEG